MRDNNQYTPEELGVATKHDAERKAALTEKLTKSAKTAETKAKGINPEALATVKQLNKTQLEEIRAKLAGIEAPKQFPEGTGNIPLAEEDEIELTEADIEEVK